MLTRSLMLPACLRAVPARAVSCRLHATAALQQPKQLMHLGRACHTALGGSIRRLLATQKLNNGLEMPLFGIGTWKSKAGGPLETSLRTAFESGYRHIDCASAYSNEDTVGKTFQEVFAEGNISRDDIWVTSKLFNKDHARVRDACQQTLKDLQLDQLDLYLMHWPAVSGCEGPTLKPSIKETWQDMERLVDDGLVKSIGISNFSTRKTKDLLSYARIKPVANQVEVHPYHRNSAIVEFCQSQGINITAYSPLGSNDSEKMFGREGIPKVLEDETVRSVAADLGWTPAQVLLKWSLQSGFATIPKSINPRRIIENIKVLELELPHEQFDRLNNLSFQIRMLDGNFTTGENTPYPTIKELWDGEVPEENLKRRGLVAA